MTAAIRRRLNSADGGFTLIELSVAMFVTLLVVAALAAAFLSSIRGIALAKQRQAATGIATATMEQFRAIDYASLSSGMTCSDLAGDTRVTLSGGCSAGVTGTFTPGFSNISEPLVLQTSGPSAAPLNPHKTIKTVENARYTIASYVTRATATSQSFNLTVIVSWVSSVSKGTKQIVQRSVSFSPSRCLSSATHPYAGACQAEFNGDAGLSKAGIVVVNADDGSSLIPGLGLATKLDLDWANLSSTVNSEQITTLTGLAGATGVTTISGTKSQTGGATATSAADTDPGSASAGVSTATLSQSSISSQSVSGTGGTLSLTPTTTDSGALDARASSTASSCYDASNVFINALSLPCSWGNVQPSGSASTLELNLPGGAPNWTLTSMAAAPSPARSVVSRVGVSGGTACPTTVTPGCLTSQASRSLGTVSLGALPPTQTSGDAAPAGWTGSLVTLSGLQESAYAEAGPGHRNPSFTRSAGTLSYYDVATGTVKTVSNFMTLPSNLSINLGTTTGTYFKGSHTTVVSIAGSMKVGSVAPIAPSISIPDTACKSTACTYSATPASTLTATLVYTVTIDGVPATRFAVSVDLGALVARAAYKAAFDA
ncbi:MAG: prepilin-type N-terminal cleavage/methylation domain-containing protein [Actinomycetota bacterium]|nr:prepilin-type N-terminal cleavage/methylation domain-containing protein [Actinomycetota bacterium]